MCNLFFFMLESHFLINLFENVRQSFRASLFLLQLLNRKFMRKKVSYIHVFSKLAFSWLGSQEFTQL